MSTLGSEASPQKLRVSIQQLCMMVMSADTHLKHVLPEYEATQWQKQWKTSVSPSSLKFKDIFPRAVVALKPTGVCLRLFISCPDKSRTNLLISAWVGWMSTSITLVLPCNIREKKSLRRLWQDETYCSLSEIHITDTRVPQIFLCTF